ncbi:MAG TPA: nicotinate phosphoribosyltransferase [Nitrososphaera sp.]|nr:nicotinate phosphoribosyltransferase [Nitrososphaera sp.]
MTIMASRLDNDFYNWTMGQFVWKYYQNVNVRYEFRNRTFSVPLADCLDLDLLTKALDGIRRMSFHVEEIDWLRQTGYFEEDYLTWLSEHHHLPPVKVENNNGHLVIETEGEWADSIFWETPILATVSEMYFRRFEASSIEGARRLRAKVDYFKAHPYMSFSDFGTRRRYSLEWHSTILNALRNEIPEQLVGTSNAWLAMEYGLRPIGTMAHQLFMVITALRLQNADKPIESFRDAQLEVLHLWLELYQAHPELLVLLPDTYKTEMMLGICWADRVLRDFPIIRQDSGDPFEVGENILRWFGRMWDKQGNRAIIFSDELNLRKMSLLYDQFGSRVNVGMGWGTGLTNDMGFEPLSIVVKPKSANGEPCVKLSDNPAKATGTPEAIARYKSLCNYAR